MSPPEGEEVGYTPEEIHEFVEYLVSTLIPDLEASGHMATAADFNKAATIIRVLMRFIEEEIYEE